MRGSKTPVEGEKLTVLVMAAMADITGVPDEENLLELSDIDANEAEKVDLFFSSGCGCKLGPKGSSCSSLLTKDLALLSRNNCQQLDEVELDMVVLSQLQALRTHPDQPLPERRQSAKSAHQHTTFYFHKLRICLKAFHSIGQSRFKSLQHHYDQVGIIPRVHGNSKRLPSNTSSQEDVDCVLSFIDTTANVHGLPLPGRMPNHRDSDVLLLPSDMSKSFVYRKYVDSCEQLEQSYLSRRKFENLWKELRPSVLTNKPATDLCFTCQQNNDKLAKAFLLPEEEREELHLAAMMHLGQARTERQLYRKQCEDSEKEWKEHCSARAESPFRGTMHYSFDYAQQIHYPYNDQQPGPAYFLMARKCQLFGVCCEAQSKQVNYLIDEAEYTGKGSNTTISLVHHYLENYSVGEQNVVIHCDNCVGQNKNNAFIFYLLWRVMTGKHKSITLSFMVAGHTKFSCDRHFGLIKKRYARSKVDTLLGVARVVQESSQGYNVPQLMKNEAGECVVKCFDWVNHFHSFGLVAVPHILKYHSFRCDSSHPGCVFIKEFSDTTETKVCVLKTPVSDNAGITSLPQEIKPKGLDIDRQWYLYEKIALSVIQIWDGTSHAQSLLSQSAIVRNPTITYTFSSF